jgi:eukaryotic-like serine/threonine-protein kinase
MLAAGMQLGPYEIVDRLGAGGMGEVWRARDHRLQRDVAIKVIPDGATNDNSRARFEREARAVAALSHPNIVAIYDVGNQDGVVYAVMELLEGVTLRERLRRNEVTGSRAIEWAHQIVQGLAAAHERGIIHRDLKPENIFVTRDGVVKILDFGLARLEPKASSPDVPTEVLNARTAPGVIVGTMGYLSPEQLDSGPIDARSDIFAFGAVLFEMLSGQPAFLRSTMTDTMLAILREEPPAMAVLGKSISAEVEDIVRHCLEKNPDERFRSARDLAFALRLAMRSGAGSDISSRPTPRPDSGARPNEVSIAVLPFRNIGSSAEAEYFSDGMTEEIINTISNIPALRVAARSSSFAFKGREDDVRKIGRDLGVAMVLQGSIRQMGTRLRVSAQIINVETGYQLWSERWDRELADVFAVQDEIADAIATTFKLRIVASETGADARKTQNIDAYDHYLKGRYLLAGRRTGEAIAELQVAADRDPEFVDAHTALADAWAIRGFYSGLGTWEAWARSRAAVDEAQRIAPDAGSIVLSQAILEYYYGWNTARMQALCRAAIERNPKSAEGFNWLGLSLGLTGRTAEALEVTGRGIELEPYNANVRTSSAWATAFVGDFESAARVLAKTIEIAPDSAYALWSYAYVLRFLGRYDESIAIYQKLAAGSDVPFYPALLGGALAAAGEKAEAEKILADLQARRERNEFVASRELAGLLTSLGEYELALDALERAREERNALLWSWIYHAQYTPLRTHPRWRALAERLGRTAPIAANV